VNQRGGREKLVNRPGIALPSTANQRLPRVILVALLLLACVPFVRQAVPPIADEASLDGSRNDMRISGTVDSGTTVSPRVWLHNYDNHPATFPATFTVGTFYASTESVIDLAPGESVLVYFADWAVVRPGVYPTCCSTAIAGDQDPANDVIYGAVLVRGTAYVGARNSKVYHRLTCRYAKSIKPANLVRFLSAAEAQARGYKPCKTCKPPTKD
jgi:hypothetical protein